jgi:hypothetical protein
VLLTLVACTGLASSALLLACAGSGRFIAPLHRVVVFPLNVVVTLPTDVESGVGPISEELRAHLEARGLEVEPIELAEAREAWLQSALALKAEVGPEKMTFEGAGITLARRLAATRSFDALIVPWIAMRAARMQGGTVSWDGTKRKVQLVGSEGTDRTSWALGRVRLYVAAPSLQVVVFAPDGRKLHEGTGGLDLVHDADFDRSAVGFHLEMTPRSVIFQDREQLRGGIALAFGTLLPPVPRAAD